MSITPPVKGLVESTRSASFLSCARYERVIEGVRWSASEFGNSAEIVVFKHHFCLTECNKPYPVQSKTIGELATDAVKIYRAYHSYLKKKLAKVGICYVQYRVNNQSKLI